MNSALHTYQKKLEQTCSAYSNKTAITYLRDNGNVEEYSYQDMFGYITMASKTYEDMGLKKGDRVAVILPPAPWAYFSIMGLAYFCATSVILDGGLQKDELHRLIIDADVSMIITSAPIYREKLIDSDVSVLDAFNSWKQLNDKEIKHVIDPDTDAIAILYSSGTTSSAKGVVIGYEQEMNAIEYLYGVVGTNEIKYLMIFPNSHVSGFTDFLAILLNGGSLANIENTSSSKLTEAFQIYKPTMFGMVPKVWDVFKEKIKEGIETKGKSAKTIFKLIEICGKIRRLTGINLGRKLFKSINDEVFGGHMQIMHVGGGKSNPETGLFFWKLGYDWSDFYASTEANIPITVTTGKDIDKGVGSISLNPNAAIKINNSDANGIGEVCVKNNMLMKGYFRDKKLTEEAFVDGYFKTGDAGYIKDGFLYITGRIKENIVLKNGEKVSPDDVETAYRGIVGEVAEFAIVGITNDELYDDIWCFVEGKEGSDKAQFEAAKNSVDANYRYVRLAYVDSIPKTSIGKIKRYELKKLAANIPKNDVTVRDEKDVLCIIQSFCPNIEVREDSRLKEDLGIDSLTMFEIVCEIERKYKVKISDMLYGVCTINDLLKVVDSYSRDNITIGKRIFKIIFDIDGTLTDFEKFIIDNKSYVENKYNVKLTNPNGYDIEQMYELEKIYPVQKSKEICDDFWNKFYLQYLNRALREGIKNTIDSLKESGCIIEIVTSRNKSCERSIQGIFVKKSTIFALKKNKIKFDKIVFCDSDTNKIQYINSANADIVIDDKPEVLNNMNGRICKICMSSSYNLQGLNENILRINSFKYNELMPIINDYIEHSDKLNDNHICRNAKEDKIYNFIKMITAPLIKFIYKPIILNSERVINSSSVIYAPNHRSTLDPFFITYSTNQVIHWAALKRFFNGEDSIFNNNKNIILRKITAILFNKMGFVPVDREGDTTETIAQLRSYLHAGCVVGMFPEGTTNKNPEKNPIGIIKKGSFYLAKQTEVIIQPVSIVWLGSNRKRQVVVNYGRPFSMEELSIVEGIERWRHEILIGIEEIENYYQA